ncbi:MAG: FAD-dependent monooxygenase, partial [Myxococcota bacterium]
MTRGRSRALPHPPTLRAGRADMPERAPVVIVGAGPVGMVLALFLDRHGVASTVFNVDTTSGWHPKGNTHNARTMEH